MFRIFTTEEFDKDFNKLDGSDKNRIGKIMKQLKEQGKDVGKPLGLPFFKEKRFGNKRLYFLVYEMFTVILAVGISDKKAQQSTINAILSEIDNYKEFIIKRLGKVNK